MDQKTLARLHALLHRIEQLSYVDDSLGPMSIGAIKAEAMILGVHIEVDLRSQADPERLRLAA